MLIRHKCDHPYCCNIEHLEIGTPLDNIRDMINRGRDVYHDLKNKKYGIENGSHKLTEKQVKEIYLSNLSTRKLSKLYNISATNVSLIKKQITWKWLTEKLN